MAFSHNAGTWFRERQDMSGQIDLLLVTPPSRAVVYQELSKDYAAIEPPVWSLLIAEHIRRLGWSVAVLDAEALGLSYDETARRIAAADARLNAFMIYGQQPSASTQCMPAAVLTAKATARLTDRPCIALGTHPSALPALTLDETTFDYVCQGEGPTTIAQLLEHLSGRRSIESVAGLWWRRDGAPMSNGWAPKIKDLDQALPTQAWDLVDMSLYRAHNWQSFGAPHRRQPYLSIQTSLGCPYACSFCCINAPFGGNGIRYWSPDAIVAQIDHVVARYGVQMIKIPDEMFVLNKRHVLGICDRLIERGYDLNIWAYARIDTIQREFLDKLRAAGFRWLGLGIESASGYVRDGVEKGRFDNAAITSVVRQVQDAGIHVSSNFIFGLPDDTMDSMQETLDFALDLNTEWANFYAAMAYPGSKLHQVATERGWLLPESPGGPGWIGYSQHAFETLPLPTEHLSAMQVLEFRDAAFQAYYSNPAYLALVDKKFGPETGAHIKQMTDITLRRRHHEDPAYYDRLLGAQAVRHPHPAA